MDASPPLNPQFSSSTPPNPRLRLGIFVVVALVLGLGGLGYAAARWLSPAPPAAHPSPSPAAPLTTAERSAVGDKTQPVTSLQVTDLVADRSALGVATAQSLQLSGGLTVTGNAAVAGQLTAASLVGGGAGLTGVNAALLNGQPGTFYQDIANLTGTLSDNRLSSNVALRNAANTFTAANTMASLSLGAPLAIASGGTGANVLALNGLVIGQGGGALATVAAGSVGQCLLATAGAPSFQACPGGGAGVASLNGLTGALTVANATAAGATITLNDASTSAKGIASFNASNFTVTAGAVNTIQNISTAATPTFAGLTAGTSLFKNAANSLQAFQVQTAGGAAVLNVDTTNQRVGINNTTPGYALDVTGDINSTTALRVGGVSVCTVSGCTTATGNYIQNTTTAQSASIAIQSANDADVTLLLKERAAQAADLIRVTDSSNNPILTLNNFGQTHFSGGKVTIDSAVGIGDSASTGQQLRIATGAVSTIGLTVNGTIGQTADIAQFNSGGAGSLIYSASSVLTLTGTLTVNGHVVTAGSAPGIAAGAAACTGPTVSLSGTDTAGLITITTGSSCGATGKLATITFANAFGAAPRVVLTPAEANAAGLRYYYDSATTSTTSFDLDTATAPANTTTYKFSYQVLQ
ncbi:MAG TPA: hypothetical protein VLI05_03535 [Candidatus Saccharimonadia bacterium]|nr:hypothetical protein [Candidatus Saccharimonadia bacterium]